MDGIDVAQRPEEIRPRVVLLLPHANGLYDDPTAAENLAFAARLLIRSPDRAGRIASALDRVQLTAAP